MKKSSIIEGIFIGLITALTLACLPLSFFYFESKYIAPLEKRITFLQEKNQDLHKKNEAIHCQNLRTQKKVTQFLSNYIKTEDFSKPELIHFNVGLRQIEITAGIGCSEYEDKNL